MCPPVAAVIGAVAAVAGTAAVIAGEVQAGDAAKAAADAEAKSLRRQRDLAFANASRARARANMVEQIGAEEAGMMILAGRQAQSQGVANVAASGVDGTSGSLATALGGATLAAELDAARMQANAALQAWGLRTEADNFERQGENYEGGAVYTEQIGLMNKRASDLRAVGHAAQGVSNLTKYAGAF